MLIVTVAFVLCSIFVLYQIKFGKRDEAFAAFPTPKKYFLVQNLFELVGLTSEEMFTKFRSFYRDLGDVFLLRLHQFDCGTIVIGDHQIAEVVSLHQPDRTRTLAYRPISRWIGADGFLLAGGSQLKSRTKPLLNVFHPNNVDRFTAAVNNHSNKVNETLSKSCAYPTDLLTFYRQSALDITFDAVLDYDLDAKNGSNLEYVGALETFLDLAMKATIDPISRIECLHPFTSLYRQEKKILTILHEFTRIIVKDRREKQISGEIIDESIMLNYYLTTKVDGKLLTDEEIRGEMDTMIFGSHDTSKTTFTFLVYSLAQYPEVQQKVFEEVISVLGDDSERDLTDEDGKLFEYTEAVIKETLRLYPPVPFVARKLKTEITTGGYTFPKDVEITISPFLMGRNPKYFDDPSSFKPDRFVGLNEAPNGYIPFSIGARKCIGGKTAILSLKIVTAKLVLKYKLSLRNDDRCVGEIPLVWDQILRPKHKLFVNLERR